jgi:hypothetical protein
VNRLTNHPVELRVLKQTNCDCASVADYLSLFPETKNFGENLLKAVEKGELPSKKCGNGADVEPLSNDVEEYLFE